MSKFEVVENKLGMIYNYGFDKLPDAIAFADKDWERATYLEQTEVYEEFYILICEDPDEESLNHFNGDVFKDYKVDAELLALDVSDPHTRVEVIRNEEIVTIVDTVKDFIEFRDNIYMSEIGAGYPFKDDIKFEFIKEREEPEKAKPVIDYYDLAFELRLIKREFISIMEKYGIEHITATVNNEKDIQYAIAGIAKSGIPECFNLNDDDDDLNHHLRYYFDNVERSSSHE